MSEGRSRRRVGQVVRRDIYRLERSDRAFLGRGNAFLESAHLGGKSRLISNGAGGAPEQGRDFRAGLREAEDVVDEEQHILVLLVTEIFCDGKTGQSHAQTGTRRFIHLPIDQRDLGLAQVLLLDDSRLDISW